MAATSPASPVSGPHGISSSEPSERKNLQGILDHHFPKIADGQQIGCNLEVMREGETAYPLVGGDIPPDAPQHWGSVSKQFTAACILVLVRRGCLRFDDDIRKLCPDLPEFTYHGVAQTITVDQLLHMQSGLPDHRHFALMTGRDPERLSNEELLDLLVQHPEMMDKPGSRYVYSNTNYDLLAKIVETVAKAHHLIEPDQTFVDFIRERVFQPHGMSARCSSDPTCPSTIDGFDAKRKQCASKEKQTLEFGATGVVGSPSDMVHWNEALARGELYRS
jgi:CubicO group peptidase (beta-lactamase class C family)